MKARWLNRYLLELPFFYALATSERTFKGLLRHLGIPKKDWPDFTKNPWSDASVFWFERDHKQTAVITIKRRDGLDDSQVKALLVHEAIHLWQEARARIGETSPSPEFEAYAVQGISQALFFEYDRQTQEKP